MRAQPALQGILALQAFGFFAQPSFACKCAGRTSVCKAFASSDAVFVGRVESVEPDFDFWGLSAISKRYKEQFSALEKRLNENDDSPDTIRQIKEIYLEIVPERFKPQISGASNVRELEAAVASVMENGKRMRLRVQEVYKGPKQDVLDVWTDFSDCAAYLLKGETYLIYAKRDERGRLEAGGVCSRNQRLTDAGEDLAYLHFISHGGAAAGRIYGFVTSNEADLKIPRLWWDVPNPVPHLILRLESHGTTRYAWTDRKGEFAFDGLEQGEYTLSVFDQDFPEKERLLSGPRKVTVSNHGCVSQEFSVLNTARKR